MKQFITYTFLFVLALVSCNKRAVVEENKTYIYISHTRTKENPLIDSSAEKIDYSKFDIVMLGGDLAYLSSEDDTTMNYLDSIFDLSNPKTLWSLGHHDYSDLERVSQYTKRNNYYSSWFDGITFIVLDTRVDTSCIIGKQLEFFNSIIDTLSNSSHLIVMTHKLIWMYNNEDLEPLIDSVSNARFAHCDYCLSENNFYKDIYPKLVEVQKQGIDVICIAGDIGFKVSEFEYKTPDGIMFLASGFDYRKKENKVLIFEHNVKEKELNWSFHSISKNTL